MVRKFEKLNKYFNSFKSLLSKVLTQFIFRKMENLGNSVCRGQHFTSGRVSHSALYDALTSNRKNVPSY